MRSIESGPAKTGPEWYCFDLRTSKSACIHHACGMPAACRRQPCGAPAGTSFDHERASGTIEQHGTMAVPDLEAAEGQFAAGRGFAPFAGALAFAVASLDQSDQRCPVQPALL